VKKSLFGGIKGDREMSADISKCHMISTMFFLLQKTETFLSFSAFSILKLDNAISSATRVLDRSDRNADLSNSKKARLGIAPAHP
jgi:hypothetical protein